MLHIEEFNYISVSIYLTFYVSNYDIHKEFHKLLFTYLKVLKSIPDYIILIEVCNNLVLLYILW